MDKHPLAASALIALGAVAGANARYWLGRWVAGVWPGAFPLATLLINLSGSLALGGLAGWPKAQAAWGGGLALLLGVGFLGAYTTFSTFSVELARLLQDGRTALALGYGLASAVGGVLAAAVGFRLAKLF
ncbi:MAG TPA: fluoride efflux transporter CrcB [Herpetosiphonaceae bacterium]